MTDIEYTDDIERVKNALAGAAAGTGGTFLPDETAREIIQIVYEQNYLRGLIPALPQARQTMKIPKLTGSVSFHELNLSDVDAGTLPSESRHATGEITMTLKTIIANIPIGNYLVAYGVEGLLQVLRDDIGRRLAYVEENLLLNGDETAGGGAGFANNRNGDYASPANIKGIDATHNDYLLLFNGLLESTPAANAVAGGNAVFALSMLRSMISKLDIHADNRGELALIVPRIVETQMLGFTELQTIDKYGPGATILSGEIGRVYGIRVFGTNALRTDLNATGLYDGVTVDRTIALLFNVRSPLIGNPTQANRRFSIGFHDEPRLDRFVLIPREDLSFGIRYTEALATVVNVAQS
tara:strand:+ start:48504 stop:49565 length:1062 start_codon:yes stop_codon:yes gene_type:complete